MTGQEETRYGLTVSHIGWVLQGHDSYEHVLGEYQYYVAQELYSQITMWEEYWQGGVYKSSEPLYTTDLEGGLE